MEGPFAKENPVKNLLSRNLGNSNRVSNLRSLDL